MSTRLILLAADARPSAQELRLDAAGHVTGSKNIPFAQLDERLPTTVKNKALPLILVCAQGKRAQGAVAAATKLGYTNVQALAGGMKAWRAADLPVEKA